MNNEPRDNVNMEDKVMFEMGALSEAAHRLEAASANADEVDPNEVGKWITVIGKAILAIFKP